MPKNALAPPAVPVLADISNPLTAAAPTPADAYTANAAAYQQWLAAQKADGIAKGFLDPETGMPTSAAIADAGTQVANALLGSKVPGSAPTIAQLMSAQPNALSQQLQQTGAVR